MKVLYITNSINSGGSTVAILNLLAGLKRFGVEPMVLYPKPGAYVTQLSAMGITHGALDNPLEVYPYAGNWGCRVKFPYKLVELLIRRRKAYSRLCRYIETFKPDIIHTNVGPIHLGYRASKQYGIPHVWHIREYQIEGLHLYPFPTLSHFLKMIHDSDSHCICITKGLFQHYRLDMMKDRVIYDGVIDREQRRKINTNKQDYILFAGRLEDTKGIKELITAYGHYLEQGGQRPLFVAGDGFPSYVKACKHLLPVEQMKRIHFLGQRDDIFELMYHAALVVVPSRSEGFGFISAEAMFNGTLVVGHNTGGVKEQFDNGLQMTSREIGLRYDSLPELVRLLKMCDNNESALNERMISDAQETVCKLYDKTEQARKVFDFYSEIL